MKLHEIQQLIQILKENGVTRFKTDEISLRFDPQDLSKKKQKAVPRRTKDLKEKDIPLQAAPPVQTDIPHHANEVIGLLRLGDEELAERLFPDFTTQEAQ